MALMRGGALKVSSLSTSHVFPCDGDEGCECVSRVPFMAKLSVMLRVFFPSHSFPQNFRTCFSFQYFLLRVPLSPFFFLFSSFLFILWSLSIIFPFSNSYLHFQSFFPFLSLFSYFQAHFLLFRYFLLRFSFFSSTFLAIFPSLPILLSLPTSFTLLSVLQYFLLFPIVFFHFFFFSSVFLQSSVSASVVHVTVPHNTEGKGGRGKKPGIHGHPLTESCLVPHATHKSVLVPQSSFCISCFVQLPEKYNQSCFQISALVCRGVVYVPKFFTRFVFLVSFLSNFAAKTNENVQYF